MPTDMAKRHAPHTDWHQCRQGKPQTPDRIHDLLNPPQPAMPDPTLLRLATTLYEGHMEFAGSPGRENSRAYFHGNGHAVYRLGFRYSGDWNRGMMEPSGALQWADGYEYGGEMRGGVPQGTGTITFPNGDVYTGDVSNGIRHGKGQLRSKASGGVYEGDWVHGVKHGRGVLTFPSGARYEGEWRGGEKHGRGVMRFASGGEYDGEWAANKRQGHGRMLWRKDGDVVIEYSGEWMDGQPEGEGTFTYHPPAVLDPPPEPENVVVDPKPTEPVKPPALVPRAEDVARKPSSMGLSRKLSNRPKPEPPPITTPSPPPAPPYSPPPESATPTVNQYTGQLRKGKRHGPGVFYYHGGGVYEGEWRENVKDGQARFTFDDGSCYVGEFTGGQPTGCVLEPNVDELLCPSPVPLCIDDLLVSELAREETLRRINSTVSRNRTALRRVYAHYSSVDTGELLQRGTSDEPQMTMLQFWKFVRDTHVELGLASVDRLFKRFRDTGCTNARVVALNPLPHEPKRSSKPELLPLRKQPSAQSPAASPAVAAVATTAAPDESEGSQQHELNPHGYGSSATLAARSQLSQQATDVHTPPQPPVATALQAARAAGIRRASAVSHVTAMTLAATLPGTVGPASQLSAVSAATSSPSRQPVVAPSDVGSPGPSEHLVERKRSKSSTHSAAAVSELNALAAVTPDRLPFSSKWAQWRKEPHRIDVRIHFREFVEALVRLAGEKYRRAPWSLCTKLDRFLDDWVRPFAGSPEPFLPSLKSVWSVTMKYEPQLRRIYEQYSAKSVGGLDLHRAVSASGILTVRQFLSMLRERGVLDRKQLSLQRALELFDKPLDPDQWRRPPESLFPPTPEPMVSSPTREEGKDKHQGQFGTTLSPRRNDGGSSFRSQGLDQTKRSFLSGVGKQRQSSRIDPNQGSRVGSLVSSRASAASCSEAGETSAVPRTPMHTNRDEFAQYIESVDRTPLVSQHSSRDLPLEERLRRRRLWLEHISQGRDGLHKNTVTVDHELMFVEFVDALVEVARIRMSGAPVATQFEALLETYLTVDQRAPL
eukprot:TRINITY_DN47542_c0_g1_i1.p1 TRINITY_DN47542_c0_g1~~TRINITY_DN47542_c0_g1_i1.p1  ORF type:complete len:1067 (+),score=267.66 TRINITY_DN47542_c0_g1_i1:53-3202(+)